MQRYEVVHTVVWVRESPYRDAPPIDSRKQGAVILAMEETFDGWVKLESRPGWILKDMRGKDGLGELLRPMGAVPVLPVRWADDGPGPKNFEVVFNPSVVVRSAPSKSAQGKCTRRAGIVVSVESQTYNGWLRLVDDFGWMLANDPQHGELVRYCRKQQQTTEPRPVAPADDSQTFSWKRQGAQAAPPAAAPPPSRPQPKPSPSAFSAPSRQTAQESQMAEATRRAGAEANMRELQAAKMMLLRASKGKEVHALHDALSHARTLGLEGGADYVAAEHTLAELRRQETERHDLKNRILRAEADRNALELGDCLSLCAQAGYREESELAQAAIVRTRAQLEEVSKEHKVLLDGLAEATASGNPAAVKTARDACKKGGVPSKEIARVYALHSRKDPVAEETEQAWPPASRQPQQPEPPQPQQAPPPQAAQAAPRAEPVFVPQQVARREEPTPAPVPAAAEEPPVASSSNNGALLAGSLDGHWVGVESGEYMASIAGHIIQWHEGPAVSLTFTAQGGVATEMFDQVFSAEVDAEGRLLWSDGDLWYRSTDPSVLEMAGGGGAAGGGEPGESVDCD